MRFITLKTFTWISILFVVMLVTLLFNSFVMRPSTQDPTIAPPMVSGYEEELVHCDPLVIVMDADGNVYLGKNRVGSLSHRLDLTTKLKEAVEKRDSLMAYASGMDLNLEVPLPPCHDEPVYIKALGDANLRALVRTLQEAGVGAIQLRVIKDRKKVQAPDS